MYKGEAVNITKLKFSMENARRCWDECKSKSDYENRRAAVERFNQQNRWKKRGMSIIPIKYGIGFNESNMNQVCRGRRSISSAAANLNLLFYNRRRRWSTFTKTVLSW